jgi:thymidylate synthase ThyX
MITAQIILDSINKYGNRLVTWELTYPRFIHSEFMTHRCFSRNAASSRAIPINKVIEKIREEPAFFEQLGLNRAGMQSIELATEAIAKAFKEEWNGNAVSICGLVEYWSDRFKLHKQILNRILEPFQHITVIASATEVDNFFHLRAHEAAQPEFQVLAYRMLNTYINSEPVERVEHLPYWCGIYNVFEERIQYAKEISVARCARVSYCRQNEETTVDEDVRLFNRLKDSGHWSPFEHVATANHDKERTRGNFKGWNQLRHVYDIPQQKYQKHQWERHLELRPSWITLT